MPYILYNTYYGGFNVSRACWKRVCEIKGVEFVPTEDPLDRYGTEISRTDPALIQAVQELGVDVCSACFSSLELYEIEAGGQYIINAYDGLETITRPDDITWLTA